VSIAAWIGVFLRLNDNKHAATLIKRAYQRLLRFKNKRHFAETRNAFLSAFKLLFRWKNLQPVTVRVSDEVDSHG